jgi:hypothetical protein
MIPVIVFMSTAARKASSRALFFSPLTAAVDPLHLA